MSRLCPVSAFLLLILASASCGKVDPSYIDDAGTTDADSDADSDTDSDTDSDYTCTFECVEHIAACINLDGEVVQGMTCPDAEVCCDVGGDTDTDTDTDSDTDTDTDTDTDSDTDTDTDSDTDTDADTDTDTGTGSDTGSGSDTDTGTDIPDECEAAAANPTSVGCDFFAADLDNWNANDPMPYKMLISNPQPDQAASVTVEHGSGGVIYSDALPAASSVALDVACDTGCLTTPQEVDQQGIGAGSGFRVTSDYPVLVQQWNSLDTTTYSADASSLLPVAGLDGTYIVGSWGPGISSTYPGVAGQVTVVATEDATSVTFITPVNVPDMGGVGPMTAGVETSAYSLDAFDVLTFRPTVLEADLTGTVVQADKPVAVFGAHACAEVPTTDDGYCDHIEEQMLPLAAWGTEAVLARHEPRDNCTDDPGDPNVWRIVAGASNMTITFEPAAPAPAGSSYTFTNQGEILDFETTTHHHAVGTLDTLLSPPAPFMAYQLMTGNTYSACTPQEGDPLMALAPYVGQYQYHYWFATEADFDYDHIVVVREAGDAVNVDCLGALESSDFIAVGTSGYEVGRFFIDHATVATGCTDGLHEITGAGPIGLTVIGTHQSVSYGYLGGTGLAPINPIPAIE